MSGYELETDDLTQQPTQWVNDPLGDPNNDLMPNPEIADLDG
jgi:hypothetical protein